MAGRLRALSGPLTRAGARLPLRRDDAAEIPRQLFSVVVSCSRSAFIPAIFRKFVFGDSYLFYRDAKTRNNTDLSGAGEYLGHDRQGLLVARTEIGRAHV